MSEMKKRQAIRFIEGRSEIVEVRVVYKLNPYGGQHQSLHFVGGYEQRSMRVEYADGTIEDTNHSEVAGFLDRLTTDYNLKEIPGGYVAIYTNSQRGQGNE